jgi:hypothetical protein
MKRTAILFSLLIAGPLFGQQITGRFEPGQTYREPDRDAPPSVSRMFVRKVDGHDVDLPATGDGGMIIVLPGHAPKSLQTTSGMQRVALDANQDVIHIDRTEARKYHLSDLRGGVVVASEPDSKLTMTTTVGPLSRNVGQPVTLHATLRDGDNAVIGAHVVAYLTAPNGVEGDAIALREIANGEYEFALNELPSNAAGFWNVRYDADGTTLRGVEFARSGSNEFRNERPSAHLRNLQVTKDGETLHISATADVVTAGRYRFDVILASARNAEGERNGIAWGESEQTLNAGTTSLTIDLPADDDQFFIDARLLDLDTMGVASRVTLAPAKERFAVH